MHETNAATNVAVGAMFSSDKQNVAAKKLAKVVNSQSLYCCYLP
jgi:hypothetical protein